jgi:four helix bundle protein
MKPYERFEAWQLCHQLTLSVYKATRSLPIDERYGLTAQARRAAFSAAANIAEGSAKRGRAEFRRFLDISIGSLSELSYTLRLSRELGHLDDQSWGEITALRERASQLTWRLYQAVAGRPRNRGTARPPDGPPARRHS